MVALFGVIGRAMISSFRGINEEVISTLQRRF
jgi:hypothetical protein